METGNAVVGFDRQTLNDIISQLFKCLHPTGILKVPPRKVIGTTTTVSISIDEAPSVDLVNSTVVPPCPVIFKIWVPSITVLLSYDQPHKNTTSTLRQGALSLTASATLNADPQGSTLKIETLHGIFTSNTDTADSIDSIINSLVLPVLMDYINKEKPCHVPQLSSIKGLKFDIQRIISQNDQLIVCAASGRTPLSLAIRFCNMPAGAFIGADAALLTMAGNQAISKIKIDKEFNLLNAYNARTHFNFGPISNVSIMDDSSRNVSARLAIEATTKVTQPYSQESQLKGIADLTLYATIKDERLCMRIQRIDNLTLEQQITGVSDWINNLNNMVLKVYNGLYKQVSNFIVGILGDWEFDVFKLQFPVPTRDGLSILIQLEDAQIAVLNTTGEALIIASGTPTVCICT
ncbi:hypothetical protein BDV27DRAFT_119380 [Aspergillus caelatus]|uniref:Uncharacterized protein n=1 Tax=Aspergillus caelatus TaxID=61420 RepID=A0A5N7AM22_9EURO|nr:uncharacterized protein BDV27DRAFT_119380 [Aspergillus caelatus]KAE8370743.1 hypothetical protein BDV27DRAFT_119380 [Aspergillus caelatus]